MTEILNDRALVLIKGSDSKKFLQGLITKNIEQGTSNLTYCLMLNAQGKYLYELFLYPREDGFIAEIYKAHKDSFIGKLKIYKLRSQVEFYDVSEEYAVLWSKHPLSDACISAPDPRMQDLGYRSIIAKKTLLNYATEMGSGTYLKLKYQLAIPEYSELVQEKSFPLEYGLEQLSAIDFDKGCYIGQEPISRTKYRGVVRKNIYKVIAEKNFKEFLELGASTDTGEEDESSNIAIMAGDTKIGKLLSYLGQLAIALVREEELAKAEEQNLSITIAGEKVSVCKPSWRE
ncbi:MAG: gcvT [Rickettsiaceae bacterium]|jgi:folate-binding protein YgfZ|nr:gcvT [Rickettsiaceae bacterium]